MMSTAATAEELQLRDREKMTREQYHHVYTGMTEHVKAQLIAGEVYMASPMKIPHGRNSALMSWLACEYIFNTPGVQVGAGSTILLDDANEPEPDLLLYLLPECGGQSRVTTDNYLDGAPEFICEVADNTRYVDLNVKRPEYQRNGVLEYVVINLRDDRVHWFDLKNGVELKPKADGIVRSKILPGLWIDGVALLKKDDLTLRATAQLGLASPEHAEFVQQLEARRAAHAKT